MSEQSKDMQTEIHEDLFRIEHCLKDLSKALREGMSQMESRLAHMDELMATIDTRLADIQSKCSGGYQMK